MINTKVPTRFQVRLTLCKTGSRTFKTCQLINHLGFLYSVRQQWMISFLRVYRHDELLNDKPFSTAIYFLEWFPPNTFFRWLFFHYSINDSTLGVWAIYRDYFKVVNIKPWFLSPVALPWSSPPPPPPPPQHPWWWSRVRCSLCL